MTPLHLHVRKLTSFEELDVDFTECPEGLVAIVGPNGAGKTTLLEATGPVPLYRAFASRPGTLGAWMRGRDAIVDATFAHAGHEWRMLLQVDTEFSAGRGKMEAFLYLDGNPQNDGKTSTFDEAVAKHFPSSSVFFASCFAVQGGVGDFFRLDPKGRKAVFAELLGLEHLQALSDRARDVRKPYVSAFDTLTERAAGLEEARAHAARLADELAVLRRRRSGLAGRLEELRAHVDQVAGEHAASVAERTRLVAERTRLLTVRSELEQRVQAASTKRTETRARLAAIERTIADKAEAEADAAKLAAAQRAIATLTETYKAQERELEAARAERGRVAATCGPLASEIVELEQLVAQAEEGRDTIPVITKKVAELEALEQDIAARLKGHGESLVALTNERLAAAAALQTATSALAVPRAALRYAEEAATLIEGVPCAGGPFFVDVPSKSDVRRERNGGACRFLVDAKAKTATLEEQRRQVEELERQVTERAADLADAKSKLAELEELRRQISQAAEPLALLPVERESLRSWRQALDHVGSAGPRLLAKRAQHEEALDLVRTLDARAGVLVSSLEGLAAVGRETRATATALQGAAEYLVGVQAAEAGRPHVLELLRGLDEVFADAETKLAELEAAPTTTAAEASVQAFTAVLEAAKTLQREAEADASRLDVDVGRLGGLLEGLGDLEAKGTRLVAAHGRAKLRSAGFRLVEQGFGRNGVQALEIDAAGPEVSRLVDGLLEHVLGGRFSLQLRTVAEVSRGTGQREVFDVEILDSLRGATNTHDGLSGGQKVGVSEALKLAIAVYNGARSGSQVDTLWRDECDGALDPETRLQYPNLLRAALRAGGFRRCLFVTHTQAVAEQADAILLVKDGTARWIAPGEAW